MILALTKVRQQVVAIQKNGLSWHAYGSDGLMGRASGVMIVINRSRKKTLQLDPQHEVLDGWIEEGHQSLIGTYESAVHSLGPQSAVLFKSIN